MAQSENILTTITHVGDSTTQTHTGDKFKGDGYYGRSDGLHTIQINLNDFIGTIAMEGTLASTPTDDDWFTIPLGTGNTSMDTTGLIGEATVSGITHSTSNSTSSTKNFTGNYVWIRAKITNWTAGSITNIKLNH